MKKRSEKGMIWVGFRAVSTGTTERRFEVVAGSTLKKLSDELGLKLSSLRKGLKNVGDPFWIMPGNDPIDAWYVCSVGLAKIEGRGGLRKVGGNSGFGGFLGMKGKDGMLKGE